MRKPGRALVLDTSCVRGTPRSALEALSRTGHAISVSSLAAYEMFVYLADKSRDAEKAQKLIARMRFLSELCDGTPQLAPTHTALVDKLGGTIVGLPSLRYTSWRARIEAAWVQLVSGREPSDDVTAYIKEMASYVEDAGRDFTSAMGTIARFGRPTEDESRTVDRLSQASGGIVDFIRLPSRPPPAERFDAYSRMASLHARRAYERANGVRRAHSDNHAIDLNLLHHLAEGLVLVTRDYELIEEVDACGTNQAPWVRTVGEVLRGRVPPGPPFGVRARLEGRNHRPRSRGRLRELDENVLAELVRL